MKKYLLFGMLLSMAVSAFGAVTVTSPANNATLTTSVSYAATSYTTTCSSGVASMGVYVDNVLQYVEDGASLQTTLTVAPGNHGTVVEEWDKCGGATFTPLNITVNGETGTTLSNLQKVSGWNQWGELAPDYAICSGTCTGVTESMQPLVSAPSMTGAATKFTIGGTKPYSDVLWSLPVLGQNTKVGIPDTAHTLLPSIHNFTYDAYFYGADLSPSQVMEFDISMYMNGRGMIWGNQCRIAGGHEWDIWDNVNSAWVPTGVACNPVSNGWNHVVITVEREDDDTLLFKTITLNGVTATLNKTYPSYAVSSSWWGVTVNYQMDGNYQQAAYSTYLDNFSLTYW